ncbi:MAG: hypothetical protein U0229_04445 [Anaeromyxobacter sp.]
MAVCSAIVSAVLGFTTAVAAPQGGDLRDLLTAARGAAPALCALAIDGVGHGGGHGFDAPSLPVTSAMRERLRGRAPAPSAEETRALVAALGAGDPCERHMAATLLGRSDSAPLAAEVAGRLGAAAAPERAAVLLALGTMEASAQAAPVARALADGAREVRANAAWALGRMEAKGRRRRCRRR